jgi:MFS family permease
VLALLGIGLVPNFWFVLGLIVVSSMATAASRPIRQSYLNGMIPSPQRATILSFDSLFSSAGGIVAQPALSRSADVYGYPVSYLFSAAGSALALPFLWRARRIDDPADTASGSLGDPAPVAEADQE